MTAPRLRLLPGGGLERDPDRPWTPESNIRAYMRMVGIPYVRLAPPPPEPDAARTFAKVLEEQAASDREANRWFPAPV